MCEAMTDAEGAELKTFIMEASEILLRPKDPDRITGKPGETCDQLLARIPTGKTFQSGFQGHGQIRFTAEKASERRQQKNT